MENSKGYQPSPGEIRKAEGQLDDTSIKDNPEMPGGKSRLRELTETREDTTFEAKQERAKDNKPFYSLKIQEALELGRVTETTMRKSNYLLEDGVLPQEIMDQVRADDPITIVEGANHKPIGVIFKGKLAWEKIEKPE